LCKFRGKLASGTTSICMQKALCSAPVEQLWLLALFLSSYMHTAGNYGAVVVSIV
jgi:hypothetical protein